jgi:hypothetical protein
MLGQMELGQSTPTIIVVSKIARSLAGHRDVGMYLVMTYG